MKKDLIEIILKMVEKEEDFEEIQTFLEEMIEEIHLDDLKDLKEEILKIDEIEEQIDEKEEMKEIAEMVVTLLKTATVEIDPKTKGPSRSKLKADEKVIHSVRERVRDLLGKFPLYPELIID